MDLTVFGHTGFIGSEFVKSGALPGDTLWLPPRWSRRPNPYKTTDMLYLISTTHNYNVFTDPTLDVKTNLVVLTEALESWKNNNPEGVFNFVSSWFVYGPREEHWETGPVSEEEYCRPKGFYSITKYAAEQLVESFATTFGLKYRILRLCNIIGPGDKDAGPKKNALQYLINEMRANRDIRLYNNGHFYRTYMDVEDCVSALRLVMMDGNLNEIYNIGTEPAQVFSELINYAHGKLNSKSNVLRMEPTEFHSKVQVKNFSMDCSKLYDLGFSQKYSIRQTLDRMIK